MLRFQSLLSNICEICSLNSYFKLIYKYKIRSSAKSVNLPHKSGLKKTVQRPIASPPRYLSWLKGALVQLIYLSAQKASPIVPFLMEVLKEINSYKKFYVILKQIVKK